MFFAVTGGLRVGISMPPKLSPQGQKVRAHSLCKNVMTACHELQTQVEVSTWSLN